MYIHTHVHTCNYVCTCTCVQTHQYKVSLYMYIHVKDCMTKLRHNYCLVKIHAGSYSDPSKLNGLLWIFFNYMQLYMYIIHVQLCSTRSLLSATVSVRLLFDTTGHIWIIIFLINIQVDTLCVDCSTIRIYLAAFPVFYQSLQLYTNRTQLSQKLHSITQYGSTVYIGMTSF